MPLPFLPRCFQKLEDKFNANEAQKVQLQTKLKVRTPCSFMDMVGKLWKCLHCIVSKNLNFVHITWLYQCHWFYWPFVQEKAETEIRKLRQTLCFKARPLPNFYKERKEQQSEIKKVPFLFMLSDLLGCLGSLDRAAATIIVAQSQQITKQLEKNINLKAYCI